MHKDKTRIVYEEMKVIHCEATPWENWRCLNELWRREMGEPYPHINWLTRLYYCFRLWRER